jgi:5-oxoprolinase (ATP-hydrolysing)
VRKFHLRPGSGGKGQWQGGDGITRHLQFRRPLQLSLLTERRVFAPYGLGGGEPGKCGQNVLCRASSEGGDGIRINLGAKNSVMINAGVGQKYF